MMDRRVSSSQSPAAAGSPASLPWLTVGLSVSALAACAGVIALFSSTPQVGSAQVKTAALSGAFMSPPARGQEQVTKMLSGIGAETFAPGARSTATADLVISQDGIAAAPVAWDRLSAGDCISVTSKSGQTFSFRIAGVRPAAEHEPAEAPKIELAVTPCADMGEPIAKAVIQPTVPAAPKAPEAARNL